MPTPETLFDIRIGQLAAAFLSMSALANILIASPGIHDIASLVFIFVLNAMMMLFELIIELHNQTTEKTNWASFWFGVIAGVVSWVAIAIYLIGAGSGVPSFIYWIYFPIFLFFNSFAINMVLQYKRVGLWREYLYGERAYIVLSLVAK